MIQTLTLSERRNGALLAAGLAVLGLVMAAAAREGAMAVHGGMALALGLWLALALGGALNDPQAPADRLARYYDEPTKFGIYMTLVWAVIGMGVGVWVAALLYWPEATPPWPIALLIWSSPRTTSPAE